MPTSTRSSVSEVMRSCWFASLGALSMTAARAQAVLQTFPLNHTFDVVTLIGDVDADGVRDLAIKRYAGSYGIDIYSLRTGALLMQLVPPAQHWYYEVKWIGDVDGDGHDDIAYQELRPGAGYTVVRSGLSGAYLYQFLWPGPGEPLIYGLDDLNGDGRCELLLSDASATVNGMQYAGRCDVIDGATGQVLRSHVGSFAGARLGGGPVVGDMDGDGVRDYLVARPGNWWGISGATGAQIFHHVPLTGSYGEYLTDIGDFNADGFDDIVFRDRGNYPFYTYERTLVFAGPSATQLLWSYTWLFQNPGPIRYYEPVGKIGDLDGDGYDDLALLGGTSSVTSTVLSGRDQSVLAGLVQAGGMAAQIWPLIGGPGDVDGDGIPDLLMRAFLASGPAFVILISGAPPGTAAFGTPCPDSTGIAPTIGIGIGARLGQTMTVNLSNATPNPFAAVLGLGSSDLQWNGTPLPIDLTLLGLPGCQWYVSGDALLALSTIGLNGTRHHATLEIPVPQNTQLLGVNLFAQWIVLELSPVGALGGATTRALRATVVQ